MAGDIRSHLEKRQRKAVLPGDRHQRFGADDGMPLHLPPFAHVVAPRLEQDIVRNADFADVVERRAADQHVDESGVDLRRKSRAGRLLGETPAVTLHPHQMETGFEVPALRQQ